MLSALIGIGATWGGILLAYDSYYWTPGHGWPVSFFVVALVFVLYVLTGRAGQRRERTAGARIALETRDLGEA